MSECEVLFVAKIRKGVAYRGLERAYTRRSKYKAKSYVRASPASAVVRYHMGHSTAIFPHVFHLVSQSDLQIRHNAIESARVACLRILEAQAGKNCFTFQIRIYPHHILRENPLASGAGADRMSTGMQLSFGKPISIAARVHKGKAIFTVAVPNEYRTIARTALKAGGYKFACRTQIVEE